MSCVGVVGDGVVGERIVLRLPLAIPGVDIAFDMVPIPCGEFVM